MWENPLLQTHSENRSINEKKKYRWLTAHKEISRGRKSKVICAPRIFPHWQWFCFVVFCVFSKNKILSFACVVYVHVWTNPLEHLAGKDPVILSELKEQWWKELNTNIDLFMLNKQYLCSTRFCSVYSLSCHAQMLKLKMHSGWGSHWIRSIYQIRKNNSASHWYGAVTENIPAHSGWRYHVETRWEIRSGEWSETTVLFPQGD